MFDGGFVNPLLAFGALLAVVPIVIHLLNRRRHKPLSFGAMRFVLAAHQRTRRRAQLESLLLLLLRVLAIALLGLAIARPYVGRDSLLEGLTDERLDVVLLVDTSASTGYREGLGEVFDRIVARARDIVGDLDESTGDRVRVILVDDAPRAASGRSVREAAAVIEALATPSPASADLVGAVALAEECLDEWSADGGDARIVLLTDMQRHTFDAALVGAGAAPGVDGLGVGEADPLRQALDRLAARDARIVVEDLGPTSPHPPNLGVARVDLLGPAPSMGAPARVEVTIANHGPDPVTGVRVALEVDDTRLPVRTVDVDPGDTTNAAFTVRWSKSGPVRLTASLPGDGLAFDDARSLVVEVAPPVRALLVNGAPDDEAIELDETGLLAAVLSPPAEAGLALAGSAPFEPRTLLAAELEAGAVELDGFDVIWLANVAQLSTRTIERLEAWTRAGGALVVSMGDQIAPADWNARAFADDGTGLLPAQLLEVRAVSDRRREYYRVRAFDETHPALAFFADERFRRLLVEVPVFEYVAAVPLPDARVLAELDDGGAPLLVERAFGRGRTYLFTTSIDSAWTRLPQSPRTLVPLTHEWLKSAARRARPPVNVEVGEPLRFEVEGYPRRPVAYGPEGRRRELDGEPVDLGGGRWRVTVTESADRPGPWSAEVGDEVAALFAVGFDAAEGDLERLPGDPSARHPALVPASAGASTDASAGGDPSGGGGELWRLLIALVLGFLVIESLFSAYLGRRRRSMP